MLKIFSVYDSKAQAYANPFVMRTASEAVRAFSSACCDAKTDFYKYAEDYTLFELGSFDELKGDIVMNHVPLSLGSALDHSTRHREHYYSFGVSAGVVPAEQRVADQIGE